MIFSIDQIIAYVSQFMTLKIGDLIFTGTPKGVGKVQVGDVLIGYIENKERKSERLHQLSTKNIQKCIAWCIKNILVAPWFRLRLQEYSRT